MKYQYGPDYTHEEGTVELVAVLKQLQRSPLGYPTVLRYTHQCRGELIATPGTNASMQDDLKTKITAMEDAYSSDGKNCGLLHNDDSHSIHWFDNEDATMLSGTVVVQPPQFPVGDGAEYAAYRSFAFAIYADYLHQDKQEIYDYKESLTFQGSGGKRIAVTELDTGFPDVQEVSQHTPQTIVQSGMSVGLTTWPTANTPYYGDGDLLQGPSSSSSFQPPSRIGRNGWLYTTTWNYVFKSPLYLINEPTQFTPET